jgi:cell wall assembly regulator SMI1
MKKDRPIERVLRYKRIQEYLDLHRMKVFPPYSGKEWNYWHVMQDGGVKPITADGLLQEYLEWKREHYVSQDEEAAAKDLYLVRPELRHEIERLKQILGRHGKKFTMKKGVPKARLRRTEKKLGYQLDPDLCALYALTDGGPDCNEWFAVGIESPRSVDFLSLDESLKSWERFVGGRRDDRESWEKAEELGVVTRDERIAAESIFSKQWWNFAGSDYPQVYLDACSSLKGKSGQIIVYYHDPDEFVYVADDFLSFFQKSNDLLETKWGQIFFEEG